MDLTLSLQEQAFRDELRAWLAENHPGPEPHGDDALFAYRKRWQRSLHEAGWAGVAWPKEHGGRGATLIEQAIYGEELVRARAPRPANVLGLAMGGPVVIAHGSDQQKRRFLEPILSAREIWCQGFSEPEAGSDLASLKTRAVRDGDGYRVSGQKVWTSYAHEAKWCMLLARTDPEAPKHKGLSFFILDMEQPGVEVRPLHQITGAPEFNELFLDGAQVGEEHLIGGAGNGWAVALTTLMFERANLALALQMELKLALGELFELARTLRRDGRPAIEQDAIRRRLAQLYTESEVLRLNAYRGLSATMRDGVPGPEGSLGKWHWSEITQELTELALELLGPQAQLDESPWIYRFLRARGNSIEGGTTEILKSIVAERVLGLPRMR